MDAKTLAIFRQAMRENRPYKGGKIGGKRSLETMMPDERIARAKKASLAAAKNRTASRLERERAAKWAPRTKSPRAESEWDFAGDRVPAFSDHRSVRFRRRKIRPNFSARYCALRSVAGTPVPIEEV